MEVTVEDKKIESLVTPSGWKRTELGALGAFLKGSGVKKDEAQSGSIPCVRYGEIYTHHNDVIRRFNSRISENVAASATRLKFGDLLFAGSGETKEDIGKCVAFVDNYDAYAGGDIVILRLNAANPVFMGYLSNCLYVAKQKASKAQGDAVVHISARALSSISINLPPIEEQETIANALSGVDELIASLDQLIAKKRDLKQAAMQQLLTGKTRLQGFSGEWGTRSIISLADNRKEQFDDGDWIEAKHITDKGVRLIQTGNIGIGRFIDRENKKYIYERSFTSLRCKPLIAGDLLICRLADPAGRACLFPEIGEDKVVTSVDVTIFRPRPEIASRVYLTNLFSTPTWFQLVSDRSGGTTHKRISRGALGRISLRLPQLGEQHAIAEMLSDMDADLAELEQRRNKTIALKQGMMQELLTGKTRLV